MILQLILNFLPALQKQGYYYHFYHHSNNRFESWKIIEWEVNKNSNECSIPLHLFNIASVPATDKHCFYNKSYLKLI